jgi:heme-degrading monooxygenase HmoA
MTSPATTPPPPYYAVIFTSRRNEQPADGYAETADRMFALAQEQPGFLGFDTARTDGLGITVCYWETEESIVAWKAHADHLTAQREGRARWYDAYELRVARADRAYGFERTEV